MDVGQGNATALWDQAVAGTFRMEEGAAKNCADVFVRFAETIDTQVQASYDTHRVTGFGGFVSSGELQTGFGNKGVRLTEALTGLQEAALKMAAAYLRAGQQFEEADALNRQALLLAGEVGTE